MEDRKHTKAKQTLDYLREKHNDLLNLEKSIMELNQLFMDMAILVETQGITLSLSLSLCSSYDHYYSLSLSC